MGCRLNHAGRWRGTCHRGYLKGTLIDLVHRPTPAEVIFEMRRHAATRAPLDHDAVLADLAAERR